MPIKSETSRLIDAIIAAGPAPLLRRSGYEKAARSFHAHSGDIFKIVQFQASMWNKPDSAEFTVNLMIVLPYVHETWTGQPLPKNPARAQYVVLQRLEDLIPKKRGWWRITPKTEVESVAAQITSALSEYGLPFLDEHSDLDVVVQESESKKTKYLLGTNRDLFLAILYGYQGNHEEAARLMKKLAKKHPGKGFGETVMLIAQRLGV